MSEYLTHIDTPVDVRNAADSIGARAIRIRRWLSEPSATSPTRRSAKDELKKLIAEARELWSVL